MQAKLTRIAGKPGQFGTQGIQIEGSEDWINVKVPEGDNLKNYPYIKVGKIVQLGEVEKGKIDLSGIRGLDGEELPKKIPITSEKLMSLEVKKGIVEFLINQAKKLAPEGQATFFKSAFEYIQ